ncbi:MAG: cytochrome d ubiquinol oxidase subunit II, partial [Planctomycetaceae bacterium]|nr:cytochrome d ubiquinol oxidase subunit II [Planctomycetaceae bacterium]
QTGILDWYTILSGVTSATFLLHHGALWLVAKTDGRVQQHARQAAAWLWFGSIGLTVIILTASWYVQPLARTSFSETPWKIILPLAAVLSLLASGYLRWKNKNMPAFLCSGLFIYFVIFTGAAAIYPNILPGLNPEYHLTIYNTSPGPEKLTTTLYWWIPGILLVGVYFTILFRSLPAVISASSEEDH